ncbi:MAG: peptidase M28 [SAR86 cluster bacterium]|uniref:Peptidase M28 n=1 Tax=SAR86 cluster bacterium TaxID=2030880 RepID=A0A2A4MQE8_9GAMM|nr:MAG: peptidase M28 [SAR86 cluster bacterium]
MTEADLMVNLFKKTLLVSAVFNCVASMVLAQDQQFIHHSLNVIINPAQQTLRVEDRITLPDSLFGLSQNFRLNSNLQIESASTTIQPGQLSRTSNAGINSGGVQAAQSREYNVRLTSPSSREVTLSYGGTIYDNATQTVAEYAQSFAETSGIISAQGVYLNKGSVWIPDFGTDLLTFDIRVSFEDDSSTEAMLIEPVALQTPQPNTNQISGLAGASNLVAAPQSQPIDIARWKAISQGDRAGENAWVSNEPMEEVYLIAAAFTEYSQQSAGLEVLAYLRSPDANLANKYIDATIRYMALYEPLLGDYPFSKFALIENFWETGYGMPSFTLLGEQIIRFPFILESSYPHEILHNWWGNGVYPDYDSGNWSEGLTAYLADHLFQEMEGNGAQYRKEMLARYKNYVTEGNDFALEDFTSRNSAASQAVGYGKTLMLWHMLRIEIGDALFIQGLQDFYSQYRFKRASFEDIQRLFSQLVNRDLTSFFDQWVGRVGAPALEISVEATNDNQARIMFAQIQSGEAYELTVPMALFYANENEPRLYNLKLSQKFEGVMAEDFDDLNAVIVDPYFDVFRQLHASETPPTLGQLFGSEKISFILPQHRREQWRQLAEAFGEGLDAQIFLEEEISELPSDESVWVLGADNKWLEQVNLALSSLGSEVSDTAVSLGADLLDFNNRSTVVTAVHPANPELVLGWIHMDSMAALPGMIEKLPHYGKYSYLSFSGIEPTNDVKGNWPSQNSPLRWLREDLPADTVLAALPETDALAQKPAKYAPETLLAHVTELSGDAMQGRGLGTSGIDAAALYIADEFREAGLQTLGGTYLHSWMETIEQENGLTQQVALANIVAVIPGSNRELSAMPIIVAAHYDHLGRVAEPQGLIEAASQDTEFQDTDAASYFAGADDNASGVSVLIEVARTLARSLSPQRSIIFVAFSGEEAGLLGSKHFLSELPGAYRAEDIYAMINLDSVGRLEGKPLQIFGSDSAYEWPFMAQGITYTTGLASSLPAMKLASSDHSSFEQKGIPAIHLFSGAHTDYHRPSDTVDKIDARGMSDIALWLDEAVVYLAQRIEPLTPTSSTAAALTASSTTSSITLSSAAATSEAGPITAREASLGTIPDFSYTGDGIKISGTVAGSAAQQAGLLAGDILLKYKQLTLRDLQHYSDLLRNSSPGDVLEIEILRANSPMTVEVTLKSR